MIWPWVKACEQASHEAPVWDGLRATWRRKLDGAGNVIRDYTSVVIHDREREPLRKYGTVFYTYATFHLDGPDHHRELDVFYLDDFKQILEAHKL